MPFVAHKLVEEAGFNGGPCGVQNPPTYVSAQLDQVMETYGKLDTVTLHEVCLGTTDPAAVDPPDTMVVLDPTTANPPPPAPISVG